MDSSWTTDAIAILDRACEHHGGWETWRSLRRIGFVFERLSGLLPSVKGLGETFPHPGGIGISPHECKTVFAAYPDAAHVGIFDTGNVRIESTTDGRIVQASPDHRRTFAGFSKNRRWSPLDAIYFFGYAVWHYHSLPFTLAEGRLLRCRLVGPSAEPTHALEIELPETMPTHSRRQTFYFDGTGRLTRHDYTADVVGSWARGAHLWRDYRVLEGFPIAMERRVVPRIGRHTFPGTVLFAKLTEARVEKG